MKPTIFNCFKPADMSSYDIIRKFKRNIPKAELGKIGHFGTLDPFACGVLLIGISGAQRLNNFVHDDLTKTYLAVGKLGVEYDTGDHTGEVVQTDDSDYINNEISRLPLEFIEEQLRDKFLGEYWQAPHKFSAAKFEGKKLYEYARDGVEIKKEKKKREIYKLEVVKYKFPYLSIRFEVSSGTYIRTLFSECAQHLGTLGTLISLVREKIGDTSLEDCIPFKDLPDPSKKFEIEKYSLSPDQVLKLNSLILDEKYANLFKNGVQLEKRQLPEINFDKKIWVYNEKKILLGMAELINDKLKSHFIFSANS